MKLLPETKYTKGFTLIELLVVIAIIAILAVVGITVFSGQQQTARDARRKSDIQAIAQALEANKTSNSAVYNVLAASNFAAGSIPTDTTTAKYCIAAVTSGAPAVAPTAWATTAACPTAPLGYAQISATEPAATTTAWRLCALLEGGTNPNTYCLANSQ